MKNYGSIYCFNIICFYYAYFCPYFIALLIFITHKKTNRNENETKHPLRAIRSLKSEDMKAE